MARIVAFLDEWRHEMLTVPHRDNRRHFDFVVNIRRLDRHAAGAPHESKIPGGHDPDGLVKSRRGGNVPSERSYRHSAYRSGCCFGIEQPMQMDDEIARVGVIDSLLRLGLPGDIRAGVVRKNTDDVDLLEILEFIAAKLGQFAAEDEMQ